MVARKSNSPGGNNPARGRAIRLLAKPQALLKLLTTAMRSPPLLAAMGTCDAFGNSRVRMVVIRKVDKTGATVYACTDIHSKKIQEIGRFGQGELCFWIPENRVQIRLLVRWTILNMPTPEGGNKTSRHLLWRFWAGLSPAARRLFDSARPGSIYQKKSGRKPIQNTPETPPMNFAVLSGKILAIDALAIVEPEHVRFAHQKTGKSWKTTRTAG